jgi:pilus assembly protein Flp/PilA
MPNVANASRALTRVAAVLRTRPDRGASLVEYTLLVALIALICVTAVTYLGGQTSEGITSVHSGLQ